MRQPNEPGNVVTLPVGPPGGNTGGPGDGGNEGLTSYRLGELERRVWNLESKVDDIHTICTRIETRLEGMATMTYVLKVFGISGGVLFLTLVGHLIIRSLSSG